MVNVTGVKREDLKGTDFKNYFTDPQKACEVYLEVFEKGFVADYPLTIMDGKLTDVLFNGSVYKDDRGNILGAVIVARDIMEQKRNEKELIEAKVLQNWLWKLQKRPRVGQSIALKAKQQFCRI